MKRGQASTEYLFLLGMLLFVLIPSVYYSFYRAHQDIRQTQVEELALIMQQSVNTMYRLGGENQEVIEVHIPTIVKGIVADNVKELVFQVETAIDNGTAVASFGVPVLTQVVGKFNVNPGVHRLLVRAMNESLVNITDVVFIP
ncbi:MAG: hypothetical protein Q7R96_02525 [Nanoarchaeota archaeon]|nr:hypothetical protein [Nanoarchaeota archaeon]